MLTMNLSLKNHFIGVALVVHYYRYTAVEPTLELMPLPKSWGSTNRVRVHPSICQEQIKQMIMNFTASIFVLRNGFAISVPLICCQILEGPCSMLHNL